MFNGREIWLSEHFYLISDDTLSLQHVVGLGDTVSSPLDLGAQPLEDFGILLFQVFHNGHF